MRVGARASIRSGIGGDPARAVAVENRLRLLTGLVRHQHADLSQTVQSQRIESVAEVRLEAHGNPVELEDPLDDLRLLITPGSEDHGRGHEDSRGRGDQSRAARDGPTPYPAVAR